MTDDKHMSVRMWRNENSFTPLTGLSNKINSLKQCSKLKNGPSKMFMSQSSEPVNRSHYMQEDLAGGVKVMKLKIKRLA